MSEDQQTFHLVAGEYLRDCDSRAPYVPADFEREGFIHCTDGAENLAEVANRYYRDDLRMYVALLIDKQRVTAPLLYEDDDNIYPHIYGPLNRDAIIGILPVLRDGEGVFQPPRLPTR